MTRRTFHGGWYCDSLPSGEFAVLFPQREIVSHFGAHILPPGEPWGIGYLRITATPVFKFAGQAHSTTNPACWEFDGGRVEQWGSFPPPCVGVSPCIYDLQGTLHRSDGSVGSQGYRYVENDGTPAGRLISGDATYGPFHNLSQYTQLAPDLWIGQGMDGGVQTWDGTVNRLLEDGACTFIRANRDGEAVAIAFVKPDGAVIIQTTMAELRALPPVEAPEPPVEPPVPPEPPDPIPVPPEPPKPIPPQPPEPYYRARTYP